MKKINTVIFFICIVLILVNLYIQYDLSEFKRNTPTYGSANSGIGVAIIFMTSWTINSIITGILFILTIIVGIWKKQLKNIYTLLNIVLIIFTFLVPPLFVGIFD